VTFVSLIYMLILSSFVVVSVLTLYILSDWLPTEFRKFCLECLWIGAPADSWIVSSGPNYNPSVDLFRAFCEYNLGRTILLSDSLRNGLVLFLVVDLGIPTAVQSQIRPLRICSVLAALLVWNDRSWSSSRVHDYLIVDKVHRCISHLVDHHRPMAD